MDTFGAQIQDALIRANLLNAALSLVLAYIAYSMVWSIYDVYLDPLSQYPGPKIRAFSIVPKIWSELSGTEVNDIPALHARYGPVVRIAPRSLSYDSGAQAFKAIYGPRKAGEPTLRKDPSFYARAVNGVDHLICAFDDAEHTRLRKALKPSLADRAIKDLEPMIKSWVVKLKEKLAERASADLATDMLKYYTLTTFDIMADLTFNESLHMLDGGELSSWVQTTYESIKTTGQIMYFKQIHPIVEFIVDKVILKSPTVQASAWEHFNHSIERVNRRLKTDPQRPDLWTKVIQNGLMTVEEHHSAAFVLMIAGTETTATALTGTTYWLLRNPEYLKQLVHELRTTFKSFDEITLDTLARLKYLDAVVEEGLRMYPPIAIALPRIVPPGGLEICGQYVPAGTKVGVHHMSTYRSMRNFKDAADFRPERWLGDPAYPNDQLDAVEPFSIGPRNCIGRGLAYHEIRLILAAVLWHFDLTLCDESQEWWKQKVHVLWEKKPLICKLTQAKA